MLRNLIAMKRLTKQNKQKEHLRNQMLLFLFHVKHCLSIFSFSVSRETNINEKDEKTICKRRLMMYNESRE